MIVTRSNYYGKVLKQYKTKLRSSSGIFKFAKNMLKSICTLITENSVHILYNFLYVRHMKPITVSRIVPEPLQVILKQRKCFNRMTDFSYEIFPFLFVLLTHFLPFSIISGLC